MKNSDWEVIKIFNLGNDVTLMFAEKINKDYYINYSVYWLDIFGRYFFTKCNNVKNYSYPVLSLIPFYLNLKKEWILSLKNKIIYELY